MLIVSGVAFSAAMMRSPSFSRFSSSVTITSFPAAMSASADSTESKGGSVEVAMRGRTATFSGGARAVNRPPAASPARRCTRSLQEIDRERLHHLILAVGVGLQQRDEQPEIVRLLDRLAGGERVGVAAGREQGALRPELALRIPAQGGRGDVGRRFLFVR